MFSSRREHFASSWISLSCGYSLESGAGKAADVARFSGGFPMSDVDQVLVGEVSKGSDVEAATPMSPCMLKPATEGYC